MLPVAAQVRVVGLYSSADAMPFKDKIPPPATNTRPVLSTALTGSMRAVAMLAVADHAGSSSAGYLTWASSQRTKTSHWDAPGATGTRSQGALGSWSNAQPCTSSVAFVTLPSA